MGLDDLEAPGLEELSKEQLSQNGTLPDPKAAGTVETLLLDMEKFPRDSQLYWRLVVTGQGGKETQSNMATVYLEAYWQKEIGYWKQIDFWKNIDIWDSAELTWGAIVGIFMGAFLGTLLAVAAVVWYRKKAAKPDVA